MTPRVSHFAAFTLLLASLTAPLLSLGQETKKVTNYSTTPISNEVYYVLKSDKSVKHGSYTLYRGRQLALATQGHYTQGRKDSIWTSYDWNGTTVVAKGAYQNDQRTGLWEFYTSKGELEQKYDYDARQMVYLRPGKNKSLSVTLREPTASGQTWPDVAPVYIGGSSAISNQLMLMRYPVQAMRNGVSGSVQVAFIIAKDGTCSDYHVTQGIGAGCDEEALRIVQGLSNGWLPALVADQPVAVECIFPVKFLLGAPAFTPARQ
ncbi:energy transducer TonB [Hymenobacter cellulosivorans]|uniref:TonB family protein n=1 Tax=Hymenobacter cellulosivorans TaxID=2932249 RepID=A0ABY4FA55_9BACT|nr:energy transducer TonB [Hymenobacter cellulosivorans]UOQ53558.1 TonB family protein [Hymenobacter cellulosivorans]